MKVGIRDFTFRLPEPAVYCDACLGYPHMLSSRLTRFSAALTIPILAMLAYLLAIRSSQLRWGATPEEVCRGMPGDELMQNPAFLATRAITIEGSPQQIWPWLAQMGYQRAGFYGYDLIENVGSVRGIRSAATIVPSLQNPKPGDRLPLSAVAHLVFGPIVPNRYLIWRSDAEPADGVFTWALYPLDGRRTRLVSRVRLRYHWTPPSLALDIFTEFADHAAVPAILTGVKDRVEGRAAPGLAKETLQIAVWFAALAELAVSLLCILRSKEWERAWLLGTAAAAILLFTLYGHAPVWIGMALVCTLGGELIWFGRHPQARSIL